MNQEIITKVKAMNLGSIADRTKVTQELTDKQREVGLKLYEQFMALKTLYPKEMIIPPKLVDLLWHEHMLDSKKYHEDCHQLCGNYIHHNPFSEQDKLAWENTKNLYLKEFNSDIDVLNWDEQLSAANCH